MGHWGLGLGKIVSQRKLTALRRRIMALLGHENELLAEDPIQIGLTHLYATATARPSQRKRNTAKIFATLSVVFGLLLSQISPATAADNWFTYFNSTTAPSSVKSGYVGTIVGGKVQLLVGTKAFIYVRTYSVFGAVVDTGTTGGAGPITMIHGTTFSGVSKCWWTGGGTAPTPRDMICSDLRRT